MEPVKQAGDPLSRMHAILVRIGEHLDRDIPSSEVKDQGSTDLSIIPCE